MSRDLQWVHKQDLAEFCCTLYINSYSKLLVDEKPGSKLFWLKTQIQTKSRQEERLTLNIDLWFSHFSPLIKGMKRAISMLASILINLAQLFLTLKLGRSDYWFYSSAATHFPWKSYENLVIDQNSNFWLICLNIPIIYFLNKVGIL